MNLEENPLLPLPAFQRWMQQALLGPQPATEHNSEALEPSAFGASPVEAVINHSARLSAHEHLAIYQRSYVARLRSCMAQQFSALEYALGEDLFRAFADDYLAAFPSTHYNLAELGRLFPAYLQANRPDALSEEKEDWIDFVIELAAFEYDLGVLFDRQAEEGYQLAEVHDAEDTLELVPTCTLFTFQFPINTFYTRFRKGEQPDLPFAGTSYCVVLRHNYQLAVYELQPEHHAFLGLLVAGMTVPAARAAFVQHQQVDADAFAQIWPVWKQKWSPQTSSGHGQDREAFKYHAAGFRSGLLNEGAFFHSLFLAQTRAGKNTFHTASLWVASSLLALSQTAIVACSCSDAADAIETSLLVPG